MNAGFMFEDAGGHGAPEAPWDLRGALGAAGAGDGGRPRSVAFGEAAAARVRRRAGGFSSGEEDSGGGDSGGLLPGEEALSGGEEGETLSDEYSGEEDAPSASGSGSASGTDSATEASSDGEGSDSEQDEDGGSAGRGGKGGRSGGIFATTPDGTRFTAKDFTSLHLSRPLVRACGALGYTKPTPIQVCTPCPLPHNVRKIERKRGSAANDDIGFPFVSLTRAQTMNEVDLFLS